MNEWKYIWHIKASTQSHACSHSHIQKKKKKKKRRRRRGRRRRTKEEKEVAMLPETRLTVIFSFTGHQRKQRRLIIMTAGYAVLLGATVTVRPSINDH